MTDPERLIEGLLKSAETMALRRRIVEYDSQGVSSGEIQLFEGIGPAALARERAAIRAGHVPKS